MIGETHVPLLVNEADCIVGEDEADDATRTEPFDWLVTEMPVPATRYDVPSTSVVSEPEIPPTLSTMNDCVMHLSMV